MKSIFKYAICALFAGLTLTACSPEEYEGANGQVPDASQYADMFTVTVDQKTNTATFTFTETQGVTPVWRVDGESYSSSTTFTKYWRKKGEHFVDCYVKNRNGMSKDPVRKTFVIEKTQMNGFGGLDKDSEHNLFNTANFETRSFYFADDSWAQIADPALTVGEDGKSFTLKIEQVGGQRWQGQFALNEMGIQTKAGTTYDFSAIITSSNPITANGVKIKICQTDDDNAILMDKDFKIKQGNEPQCVYASELQLRLTTTIQEMYGSNLTLLANIRKQRGSVMLIGQIWVLLSIALLKVATTSLLSLQQLLTSSGTHSTQSTLNFLSLWLTHTTSLYV